MAGLRAEAEPEIGLGANETHKRNARLRQTHTQEKGDQWAGRKRALCFRASRLLALAESSVHFVGHLGCRMKLNLAK